MLNKERINEALKHVQEPVRGRRSLVELQYIRDVMIKEDNVSLTLLLLEETDEAAKTAIRDRITQIVQGLGVAHVHIRLRPAAGIERERALQDGESAAGGGTDSEAQRTRTQAEMRAEAPAGMLGEQSGTQFIAIASGKGGVGKSTVTVNLAVALARKGKRVGLIDADIYGFSVPDMMGIEQYPQMEGNKIIPVERYGVKVISMGFFVENNAPVIWRGPMLGKMLRNFFNEVEWGELDIVLLDLPPGTGDVALDVHQMLPHSKEILVTTPHATAAFVAARAGVMAKQTNHEVLGVVENMAYYECGSCGNKDYVFGRGGGARLAEEMHTELLAQIPLGAPDNHPSEPDYSPSVYKPDSKAGQIYLEVADRIISKLA